MKSLSQNRRRSLRERIKKGCTLLNISLMHTCYIKVQKLSHKDHRRSNSRECNLLKYPKRNAMCEEIVALEKIKIR